jgi:hypothetical protein
VHFGTQDTLLRRPIDLFKPTALFVFLATAAGTEVVPAGFRLIAAKWPIRHPAIDKSPGSTFFPECGDLVVLNRLTFLGICRYELDASLGILFFSANCFKYLKTLPLGFFGPFSRTLTIQFSPGAGVRGSLDKVNVCLYVSGIPRAH